MVETRQTILLLVCLVTPCIAFSPALHPYRSTVPANPNANVAASSLLFRPTNRPAPSFSLSMSDEPSEPEGVEAKQDKKAVSDDKSDSDEKRSASRTVLLTVPLFCKFVIVLVLKFVTDLVVFPLLYLYRLAGLAKRKTLKLFGKDVDKDELPNGETS